MEIVFSVNFDRFTDVIFSENDKEALEFHKSKTGERIKHNLNKIGMPLTNLVDLEPYILHRGIFRMAVTM